MPLRPRRSHVTSAGLWEMQIAVPYPKAIRCGEMVFTCGQCDLDEAGRPLRANDLRAQTDQTMAYAYSVISEAGAMPRDLVRLQVFYVNDGGTDEDAYRRHLAAILRAAGTTDAVITLTPLPHFYYPGMVVEIDAVAVLNAKTRHALQAPDWIVPPFTAARRAGEMIFIVAEPRDAKGMVVHPGEIAAQTAHVLDAIDDALAAFGADREDLVKLSCYYQGDESAWRALAQARADRLSTPVITDVPLGTLSPAGAGVRMEAVAMRGLDGAKLAMERARPAGHWQWPVPQLFPQAVRCRDKIFVGAQLPLDATGRLYAPDNVEAQTRAAMESLGSLLARCGVGFGHVVKANTYYVGGPNPDDLHRNMGVRNRYYRKPGPASTGVPVATLPIAGAQVAIEAFAMTD